MVQRLFDWLPRQLSRIAALGTGMMLLIVFCNVLARFIFNTPFYWAEEVTGILIVFVTLLPAAQIWNEDRHIQLDLFSGKDNASSPVRRIIVCASAVVFNGVLCWQAVKATKMIYRMNMCEPSLLGSPMWIVYSALVIGSGMLFLVGLRSLFITFRQFGR
ncbi:TRAP transporter small permease [Desulfocurvus sp. DL9XJH121]